MLVQHCINVIQMFRVYWVLLFTCDKVHPSKHKICITFIQCRTNVEDAGPTLYVFSVILYRIKYKNIVYSESVLTYAIKTKMKKIYHV